ncbi:hypothetical protein M0802_001641 [Mischocyttarus mexicanus]|nr:hypothetical protein M0802_001641 [Mischocyttarus mexicanus]
MGYMCMSGLDTEHLSKVNKLYPRMFKIVNANWRYQKTQRRERLREKCPTPGHSSSINQQLIEETLYVENITRLKETNVLVNDLKKEIKDSMQLHWQQQQQQQRQQQQQQQSTRLKTYDIMKFN